MKKIFSLFLMMAVFSASLFAATYTVAGSSAAAFGSTWNPENTANDMTLVDGVYTLVKEDVTLPAGTLEYKVCQDHAWTTCWPGDGKPNAKLEITEAGKYTLTFTFVESTGTVNASAQKTEDAQVDPKVSIKGAWDSWAEALEFNLAEDKKSASYVLEVAKAATYEFKVIVGDGDWRSNEHEFTRDDASSANITGNSNTNMKLVADVAGNYTFDWTFASNTLVVTFPEKGDDPITPDPETPVDSMTVYFYNNLGWADVNAFVWPAEGNAYKTWPGEAAKKETEKINEKDVYSYTFPASYVNIIFNNGTAQTADLEWDADKPYFVPGEKDEKGKYTGTWYAKADIPTGGEEPQPSGDVMTVSYNGKEVSNPEGFFTHDAIGKFNFNTKFNGATYDGIEFTSGLKFESSTKILFTTTKTATVTIVQSTYSANTIKFDDVELAVNDAVAGTGYRAYTLNNVAAGDHSITRGSGESGLFYVKVEYAGGDTPEPPVVDEAYYLKNNWDGGEWRWLAMSKDEADGLWKLENVFGENGVNLNTKADDADAAWYALADIAGGDKIQQADTVRFIYDSKEKALSVVLIGRPSGTPEPPVVDEAYYLKNNWDGGEWRWLAMSKDEADGLWKLENVFGENGVNLNSKAEDDGSEWLALKDIAGGDKIQKADTVRFIYDAQKEALSVVLIGRPAGGDDPQPGATKFYIAGSMTDWKERMVEMAAGEKNSYSVEIALEADTLYEFKVVRVQGTDTAWYGAGQESTMHYGNSTDWSLFGEANVGLQTTKAANYKFIFVANEAKNISVVIPAPDPEAQKYYLKNNWDKGEQEWSWKEMTAIEEGKYQLANVVFGLYGVNVNTKADDDNSYFVSLDKFLGDKIQSKDTVTFVLNPADSTITATLIGRPAGGDDPQPGAAKFYIAGSMTDWKERMVEMAAGEKNSYSVEIALEADTLYEFKVVRVQGTDTAWYGAGQESTMHYGNSTDWSLFGEANVGLQTTKAANYKFIFVANEAKNISVVIPAPDPEAQKYYLKNNWDKGEQEWSWKEMTAIEEGKYQLANVVFGLYGVNVNTKADDDNSYFVSLDKFLGDKIQSKDTVTFVLNPADSTITATLIGRPAGGDDPQPQDGFYLVGTLNDWTPAEAYLFKENEGQKGEYYLNVNLTEGDEIKVAYVENGEKKEWYPSGDNNNYVVDAAHAGSKTIYFQKDYKEDWADFGGFFYIADNGGAGLFNAAVEGKAVKTISNGMLIIEKAGVRYNVMGQIIR